MDLNIRIDDDDAQRKLRAFEVLVSDLRGFWPLVHPLFIGWMRKQFDSEGDYGGSPWAPLSPVYALQKAANYPGAKGILRASGQLRQAASRPTRTATPHSLTLAIDDPKLAFHQDGTSRMPARPLVFGDPLPQEAHAELEEAAERYVNGWVRAFG